MKKLVAFLLAAMMCVTALTACGGSGGSSDSGSSSGSGEKAKSITVNIWDSNQQKGIQEIADKWTETSGVKVNVEVVDWDNYWTLLEAGASGGTMPDVFWMHSNTAQMYMENDILLKLNDYIDKDSSIDMITTPSLCSTTRLFLTSTALSIPPTSGHGKICMLQPRRSPRIPKAMYTAWR